MEGYAIAPVELEFSVVDVNDEEMVAAAAASGAMVAKVFDLNGKNAFELIHGIKNECPKED